MYQTPSHVEKQAIKDTSQFSYGHIFELIDSGVVFYSAEAEKSQHSLSCYLQHMDLHVE